MVVKFLKVGETAKCRQCQSEVLVPADAFITNEDIESDITIVEHTGKAIETSRNENDKLEERIDRLGAEPLHQRNTTMVATGVAINNQTATSDLQAWLNVVEMGILLALRHAFRWVGATPPEDLDVDIFRDFDIQMTFEDSEHLLNMRREGEIDQEVYLIEEKRRGTLKQSHDIQKIIENTQNETRLTDQGGERDGTGETGE